ncbi:recombination regulator RecX [Streptococcus suis]|uniref:recombination regulator RecX n=1 Tax=Streptococcus suis TaxID=1307 RepID=UPI000CF5C8D6|nr:recombination regulator RecX [Streptococcus suis]AXI66947.1 recombination regulator RecX [Streptococcus suis]MCO8240359.1 recombination regulator RecX [Streptococcus suis]HEM3472893.1 recombination regulator RecX [Streptococcus suis]HEM3477111.1 recombination regulator RecX [Streptococcus suis]HEM3483572.1 recombination regulator RecX [Streptococcus suis]
MRITKIEKKKRLYLLEVDGQDSLYITEDTIVRFMLSKGKEITEQEFCELRDFAQFSYGKNLALYYLSFKQRTKKEVSDYLKKYEIEENNIVKIVTVLEEEKWLDDGNYVDSYVRQNALNGDKGPAMIRQKLMQKGIPKPLIDKRLAEEDFSELAGKIGEKLVGRYQRKLPLRALQDKVVQGLMGKGFSYETAKQSLGQLELVADEENEDDLIAKELDKQYRKYSRKYEGYELKQRLILALARKGYDFDRIQTVLRDYL